MTYLLVVDVEIDVEEVPEGQQRPQLQRPHHRRRRRSLVALRAAAAAAVRDGGGRCRRRGAGGGGGGGGVGGGGEGKRRRISLRRPRQGGGGAGERMGMGMGILGKEEGSAGGRAPLTTKLREGAPAEKKRRAFCGGEREKGAGGRGTRRRRRRRRGGLHLPVFVGRFGRLPISGKLLFPKRTFLCNTEIASDYLKQLTTTTAAAGEANLRLRLMRTRGERVRGRIFGISI